MLLSLGQDVLGIASGMLTFIVDIIGAATPKSAAGGGGGNYPTGGGQYPWSG